jgi:cytidine deaminase
MATSLLITSKNVSFPVGCCAETNAIYGAINTVGRIKFDYIVIVADSKDPISPCGICRQVMREHVSDDFKIYMGDSKGIREVKTMKEILPGAITNLD